MTLLSPIIVITEYTPYRDMIEFIGNHIAVLRKAGCVCTAIHLYTQTYHAWFGVIYISVM